MAKDLKVYNHLNYNEDAPTETDGFIHFLQKNSEIKAPEIDIDAVWDRNKRIIYRPKKSFARMKIAASVAILAMLSISLYLFDSNPPLVQISAANEKVSVSFPDGSTGLLNANASFEYPQQFGEERNVKLTGEAYFDIKKSDKPFIIDVNGVDVTVLGTAFNLIADENHVKLYVDRGLVAFEKDGQQTHVKAGNEAIFNKTDNSVKIFDTPSSNIMSWRNGVFNFENTPLNEALNELGEYYEVDFKLVPQELSTCRVSASFNRQPLKEVLKTLSTILNVKASKKADIVKISGEGC